MLTSSLNMSQNYLACWLVHNKVKISWKTMYDYYVKQSQSNSETAKLFFWYKTIARSLENLLAVVMRLSGSHNIF